MRRTRECRASTHPRPSCNFRARCSKGSTLPCWARNSFSPRQRVSSQGSLATRRYLISARSPPGEHVDRGKKPLVHIATAQRRIRFREVELKPKQAGDAPVASLTTLAKSSSVAKKVKSQMDHVMSGSAGPTRRGRGGKKRGLTRPKGKGRDATTEDIAQESLEQGEGVGAESASVAMDTS